MAGQTGATFISIPTIVSTGTVFQSTFPARREGKLYLVAETVVPLHTLFDTDIIHAAPAHLNAAGMAECVCLLAGVASWRWWCEQGLDGHWNHRVEAMVKEVYRTALHWHLDMSPAEWPMVTEKTNPYRLTGINVAEDMPFETFREIVDASR